MMNQHFFGHLTARLFAGIILLLCAVQTMPADAHALWINMTDYHPPVHGENLAKTKMYMGWGHRFPVDGYVAKEDFNSITLIAPDGKKRNITLETTGFAASELSLSQQGLYFISVERHGSYNTKYRDADGKEHLVKKDMTGLEGVYASTYSQQFAKTLFLVGDEISGDFSRPLGQKLEIVPLTNPYRIVNNTGGNMTVQVLFEGKPAEHLKLYAKYEGFAQTDESSCVAMTDRNGVAHIRITHWGPWVIKTGMTMESRGMLKGKVLTEGYYASLTFLVP